MNFGGVENLKIFGIGPQLDLGNFTVGIATIFVAFVTLYVAVRNTKSTNNHKLAEFRQLWIDDLRTHIAHFVGCVDGALNYLCSVAEGKDRHAELDKQFSEVKRLETYVILKLNPNERDHRILTALIVQTRGRAAAFSQNQTRAFADEIHNLTTLIIDFSRFILKTEWDRVRYETRGRWLITRFLSSRYRAWRRRDREMLTRSRVDRFFERNGIAV